MLKTNGIPREKGLFKLVQGYHVRNKEEGNSSLLRDMRQHPGFANSLIFFPLAKPQENPGVKCQNLYHILSWREEFLAQNKENLFVNTGSCVISAKDNNQ